MTRPAEPQPTTPAMKLELVPVDPQQRLGLLHPARLVPGDDRGP